MKQLKRIPVVLLLLVCFLCLAYPNAASAQTAVYFNQTTFNNLLAPGYFTELFNTLPANGADGIPSPQPLSGGGFTFEARADSGTLYGLPSAISTNSAGINLFFDAFSPNVTAVGGDFFSTDFSGIADLGPITLTLVTLDPSGDKQTLLSDTTSSSFVGFLSPGNPILYLEISAPGFPDFPGQSFATAMNFEVGNVAETNGGTAPEPATFVLLGAGLIFGGLLRKRLSRV